MTGNRPDLVSWISRWRPNYRSEIEGASQSDIARLEDLAGGPLPDSYRRFLVRMGLRQGGLDFTNSGTADIRELIVFLEQSRLPMGPSYPPGGIPVGIRPTDDVVCLLGDPASDPPVFLANREPFSKLADSFDSLMFRTAFALFRLPLLKARAVYSRQTPANLFSEARDLALSLGFREEWFSDTVGFCGEQRTAEGETTAILIEQYGEAWPIVEVAGPSADAVRRIGAIFESSLGLHPSS
jgi:hypothetical protein